MYISLTNIRNNKFYTAFYQVPTEMTKQKQVK